MPPTGLTAPAVEGLPSALAQGTVLGPYTIGELVGAGGMGEVYRAVDSQLRRDVAIKVLRPALVDHPSDRAHARLFREAQTMARLSHPNVLAVHEIGNLEGLVFIVMDFVEGETLRAWLRRHPRGWREIVEMFVQAARGLAAAHRAGVVHRDFKPDNVLVDREGRARVTDFGVAGVAGVDDVGDDPGPVSAAGAPPSAILGTPQYMAPEQHRGAADPRADQFAFCVALYEALHGVRPFAGASASELLANISAGNIASPPRPPSLPAPLRRVLARGLRPDPDARFPSMEPLLAALERGLLLRRPRALVLGGGVAIGLAILALALVGRVGPGRPCLGAGARLAGVWDNSTRAALQGAFLATGSAGAADGYRRVADTLDAYARAWVSARTEACEATAVRKEQSPALLDLRMQCLDRRAAELGALTHILAGDLTPEILARAPVAARSLEGPDRCSAAAVAGFAPPSGDGETRTRTAALQARLDEVWALERTGQLTAALALARPAATEASALNDTHRRAEALLTLAGLLEATGDFTAAEVAYKEARQAAARSRDDVLMARISVQLAMLLVDMQTRPTEVPELLSAAEAQVERAGGSRHLRLRLGSARGMFLVRSNRPEEARRLMADLLRDGDPSLPPDDPDLVSARSVLGLALRYTGDYALAEVLVRRALADGTTVGPEFLSAKNGLILLGTIVRAEGRLDEAASFFQEAAQILERTIGGDGFDMARVLTFLGGVRVEQGRYAEALELATRALAIRATAPPTSFFSSAVTLETLGLSLAGLGQATEALARLDEAVAVGERTGGATAGLGDVLTSRAAVLLRLGRIEDARADDERALELQEHRFGRAHPAVAIALIGMASCDLRLGQSARALAPLERAIVLLSVRPSRPWQLAEGQFALARALRATGEPGPRARELAVAARTAYAISGAAHAPDLAAVDAWLARAR